ncbi:MAG: hypothetical protein ACYDD1_04680 [Caulobacteraceae bacterium]
MADNTLPGLPQAAQPIGLGTVILYGVQTLAGATVDVQVPLSALSIPYNDTITGLGATTVQAAIAALYTLIQGSTPTPGTTDPGNNSLDFSDPNRI